MAAPLTGWAITGWAITGLAHPGVRDVSEDCKECLAHAMDAANHARLHGSSGATYGRSKGDHSATVTRAYGMVFTGAASSDEIEFINGVSL